LLLVLLLLLLLLLGAAEVANVGLQLSSDQAQVANL
jgi:hypothetical protein